MLLLVQDLQQAEEQPSKHADMRWRRSFVQVLNAVAMKDAPRSSSSSSKGARGRFTGEAADGGEDDAASQADSDISR